MNLYYIWQSENDGYDTYDAAIVAAKTQKEAKMIHPGGIINWDGKRNPGRAWVTVENVNVELIGKAKKGSTKGSYWHLIMLDKEDKKKWVKCYAKQE